MYRPLVSDYVTPAHRRLGTSQRAVIQWRRQTVTTLRSLQASVSTGADFSLFLLVRITYRHVDPFRLLLSTFLPFPCPFSARNGPVFQGRIERGGLRVQSRAPEMLRRKFFGNLM